MSSSSSDGLPAGWNAGIHRQWLGGQRVDAVQALVAHINSQPPRAPEALFSQFAYYLFLLNDFRAALKVLEGQYRHIPGDKDVVRNLAVCLSRLGRHEDAVRYARESLALQADDIVALDVLSSTLSKLGRHEEAGEAGTRALIVKDRGCPAAARDWAPPSTAAEALATGSARRNLICFSIWGTSPRYLRGAVHNILAAHELFPGWVLQFHVDASLPPSFPELLESLGAEVQRHQGTHSSREKLCWRFGAANDPGVARFLVRDADSVFSEREVLAVEAWIESGRCFHVIRDWWTHTDLMLAGLWGGVSGVLPDLSQMLGRYHSGRMETPNIDQWFLRDRVWPYVRQSCLVHDRCFRMPGSTPPPGPLPDGNRHMGQCEFTARRGEQQQRLASLLAAHPSMRKILALD